MIIKVDKKGTTSNFINILDEFSQNKKIQGILVLACDANDFAPDIIDKKLKAASIPIFGGIFPGIIYGQEKLEKGTIAVGIYKKPNILVIPHLSDELIDYDDIIEKQITDTGETKTIFVFVDGFSKRINALIEGLFNIFGLEFNYIGGGAGSLSMKQKSCLFTNEGLIKDSAVVALMNVESSIGVTHGWRKINGPYKVTEADRNTIKTLDWIPAFDVYREIIEKHSNRTFSKNKFFDISKCYPFGINKLEAEEIVRDPFQVRNDGSLICIGEIPQDSFINILTGDPFSLINAAGKALAIAKESFKLDKANRIILFMDCISRALFLGNRFDEELLAVYDEKFPLIGALTIGEIANSGKDYLEFYNKTSVVGILGF